MQALAPSTSRDLLQTKIEHTDRSIWHGLGHLRWCSVLRLKRPLREARLVS